MVHAPLHFLARPSNSAVHAAARDEGFTPLQSRLIAQRRPLGMIERAGSVTAAVRPRLGVLDAPTSLPDIDRAAARIARAIIDGEEILCSSDHDSDGVSGSVVVAEALGQHFGVPTDKLHVLTTSRLTEGFGLSIAYCRRILAEGRRPSLLITVDQGSSDAAAIEFLRAATGTDVCVLDHHLLPVDGPPRAAYACVNPMRSDSRFPDPGIAGCHVAFLTMAAVRRELIRRGHLSESAPRLDSVVDVVGLGTLADAMGLSSSLNNRALVAAALERIGSGRRPCWNVLRDALKVDRVRSETLMFGVSPRIAAAGRLGSAMPGVHFLAARDAGEAAHWFGVLDQENIARRALQATLVQDAIVLAEQQVHAGAHALVLALPDGHQGVGGLVASRCVERFGRPTVCLSPKQNAAGVWSGSVRGVPGFHCRVALQNIQDAHGCQLAFGGHEGAAGCALPEAARQTFAHAFEAEALLALGGREIGPWVDIDGPLDARPALAHLDEIDALEPFGRCFEYPVFADRFTVLQGKPMGNGTHYRLSLAHAQWGAIQAVWFNAHAEGAAAPVLPQQAEIAYSLKRNEFRGRVSVQLQVRGVRAAA